MHVDQGRLYDQPFGVDGFYLKAYGFSARGPEHEDPALFKGPGTVDKLSFVGWSGLDDMQGATLFEPVSGSAPGRRKGVSGGAEDHPASRILLM